MITLIAIFIAGKYKVDLEVTYFGTFILGVILIINVF